MKKKVIVFIDGSNLYYDLKDNFAKMNLDFKRFSEFLCAKNKLVKVYYYSVPVNQRIDYKTFKNQQKFFSSLEKNPKIKIKLGRLEKRPNGPPVEKGVDVKMAVDIVTHAYANLFDVGIIVSRDADFVPAIQAAQDFGKEIVNICFPKTKSYHLNQVCDRTIFIGKKEFKELQWEKS
ncbi:MAG: NYN domain-containing protein [archaeon]